MSIPGKLLIALLSAFVVSLVAGEVFNVLAMKALFGPTAAAALLAVVLSHKALPMPGSIESGKTTAQAQPAAAPQNASRGERRKTARPARNPDKRSEQKPRKSPAKAHSEEPAAAVVATASQSAELETGKVKWFNGSKGFGFLIRENGEEVFVHHRSIVGDGRRNLSDGADVRFRVVTTDKGPQAEDVEPQE